MFPFIGQLERAAGFERGDSVTEKLSKLDALVARSTADPEHVAVLASLFALPGSDRYQLQELSPQKRKEKTLAALLAQLDALAARPYVGAHFFPGTSDGTPNRPVIESALPKLGAQFAMLDRAVAKTGHLVGSAFTLADMNVLPMLFYLHHLPESGAMLRRNANLASYYERHIARPSVKEAVPPPFPGRSSWTVEGD